MVVGSGDVILMYHRIAEPRHDRFQLCVSPDRFAEQIAHLRRHHEVVQLSDLHRRASRPRVVLTFDDGYLDNLTAAKPVLEAAGVPATVFVTSGLVDSTRDVWWDRLHHVLFDAGRSPSAHLQLVVASRRLRIDVRRPEGRERAYWGLYWRLKPLPVPQIDAVLEQVRSQMGGTVESCREHRFVTVDQLRELAGGVVEIGGHATSHSLLANLPPEQQQAEVHGGRERLQALTGAEVATFAYPFGDPSAYSRTTVAAVRRAGYRLACSTRAGRLRALNHRFRLPRHLVGDWDGEEFGQRLRGFLKA